VASAEGPLTLLLTRWSDGDEAAGEEAMELVYGELHRVAQAYMRRERRDHTLQPTALVHEAFLRLCEGVSISWTDRAHFFRLAARAMRRILTDHARKVRAAKRGGGAKVPLRESKLTIDGPQLDVLALDEVLRRLAVLDARQATIIELRFFGGLTVEETARALDLSPITVKRDWRSARAWLKSELDRRIDAVHPAGAAVDDLDSEPVDGS
jgi:RNA polymerase sigma factor (TIGR02999 family)